MSFEQKLEDGLEALRERDYDKSLDIARDLQKMEPDSSDGYHLEAMVFQKLNQWEPSVEALDKAIKLDAEKSGFYNLRGFAKLQLEELNDAEKDFKKAIELDDSPAAHRNLVLHKIMSDDGNEAISYLLDRIRSNPRDIENWILMGDLMQRAGQDDKAKSYYEQARKMDPENEYVEKQLSEM